MSPKWYVNAVRELEDDLDNDRTTQKQFTQAMRELDRDLDEEERAHGQFGVGA